MSKSVKDVVAEKFEIVDQPEETGEGKGFKFWLVIPAAILAVGAVAFFVVRRVLSSEE